MTYFYAYAPHAGVLRSVFDGLGINPQTRVRLITEPQQLQGLDGGYMFNVVGWRDPLPQGIRNQVELNGMVWIIHDDGPARRLRQALGDGMPQNAGEGET